MLTNKVIKYHSGPRSPSSTNNTSDLSTNPNVFRVINVQRHVRQQGVVETGAALENSSSPQHHPK